MSLRSAGGPGSQKRQENGFSPMASGRSVALLTHLDA